MSTFSSTTRAGRTRPSRRVQLLIWVLFVGALLGGFASFRGVTTSDSQQSLGVTSPAATSALTAATVAAPAAVPGRSTLAQGDGSLLLAAAGDVPACGGGTAENGCAVTTDRFSKAKGDGGLGYADDPSALLPAFRWSSALDMPDDLKLGEQIKGGATSMLAGWMFGLAAFIWGLLLHVLHFAIGFDIVKLVGTRLDGLFLTAAKGLGASGLPILAVIITVMIAALRSLRGKTGQAFTMIVSATLVVSSLSFIAASASKGKTFDVNGQTIQGATTGSPAYLAAKGNEFVSDIVGSITTGFGSVNKLTDDLPNGQGDEGGATCSYYLRQMDYTYRWYAGLKNGDSGKSLEANSMGLVNYMWQRSMYDNYTSSLFGTTGDGSRIVCHVLENNAHIDAQDQFAMVGGDGDGTAKYGPYAGMKSGPFYAFKDDQKDSEAAAFAWAACGANKKSAADPDIEARDGWSQAGGVANKQCTNWFTYAPTFSKGVAQFDGGKGINSGFVESIPGNGVLKWRSKEAVDLATGYDGKGTAAHGEALHEVNTVVTSYYGYSGSKRILGGMMAFLSACAYLWVFATSSIGALVAQIGLLFLLVLLPYTLLMLAFPNKDGGRNAVGVRMLKLTGAFFGGKAVFLALLSVTVQLISLMFEFTQSFSGKLAAGDGHLTLAASGGTPNPIWSLIIPVVTIFILKTLTKALGLGNLMSVSGGAGFATSAVMSGKENRGLKAGMQGKMDGTLKQATDKLGFGKDGLARKGLGKGANAANPLNENRRGRRALTSAMADGNISAEDAAKVAAGKMTLEQAKKNMSAHKSNAARPDADKLDHDLESLVGNGAMTMKQASKVQGVRNKQTASDAAKAEAAAAALDAGSAAEVAAAAAGQGDGRKTAINGYAGAQSRAAGKDTGSNDPVEFVGTLDPTAGTLADSETLLEGRAKVRSERELRLKGADSAVWQAQTVDSLADGMENLRAVSQGTDLPRTLSPREVEVETRRQAQLTGMPPELVLVSDSGTPPTFVPVNREKGSYQYHLELDDGALLKEVLSPVNYIGMKKQLDESREAYATRVAVTAQTVGVIDDAGNSSDVVARYLKDTHNIDVHTKSGADDVINRVRAGEKLLDGLKIPVPNHERRAIQTMMTGRYPQAHEDAHKIEVKHVVEVSELAEVATDQADKFKEEIAKAMLHVNRAQTPREQTVAIESVIRSIESAVPSTKADIGAVYVDALTTKGLIGEDSVNYDQLMKQANALIADRQDQDNHVAMEIAKKVVALKQQGSEDAQASALKELVKYVNKTLESSVSSMDDALAELVKKADEVDRTRREQLATQGSQPNRGPDYASGKSPLP